MKNARLVESIVLQDPRHAVRVCLNASASERTLASRFLNEFFGAGTQHIALSTSNIYETVDRLKAAGVQLLDSPDTYYEGIPKRLPDHREPVEELKKRRILIDGHPGHENEGGILLQIFTETVIGPIFFEIIQRKGDEGFGEGNFKALFESMELDQVRRGVLKPAA